jgi:diaminopimelate decarboxylase
MTWRLFCAIKEKYAPDLALCNFGGGFGIPYLPDENELDLVALKAGLRQFASLPNSIQPYVETGRFIVGQSGRFIVRVAYRKESRGQHILIVNGGMNNNFSVVGAAQFERRNYIVHALTGRPQDELRPYTIVGPSCYSMDTLASDIMLPEMRPGDFLCFENSGCYGLSFSPTLFLGQKRAVEYFVDSV